MRHEEGDPFVRTVPSLWFCTRSQIINRKLHVFPFFNPRLGFSFHKPVTGPVLDLLISDLFLAVPILGYFTALSVALVV